MIFRNILKAMFVSGAVILLGSCSNVVDKNSSEESSANIVKENINVPLNWATVAETYAVPNKWVESFNDATLLKFIEEAKANNFNLKVAAGNMEKAWLLAEQSGAALQPTADITVGRSQSGSANSGSSNAGVNVGVRASWELDVWGRISAGVDAATASAQAVEADYIFSQYSLSSNVAKSYFKVIEAKLQAAIARENLNTLEETMRITNVKYRNGLSTGQDVAVNRANLASAQEQLTAVESAQRDAIRALQVLLGRYPDAALELPDELPVIPKQPPAGLPSDILERRPDIIAAERKVASAFNATKEAEAARLPRFSLSSEVGGASSSLSDVLDPANVAWQLGANIIAPLMDGGQREINLKVANVEQKQAIANYTQAALTAFSEVESNLDQGYSLSTREVSLLTVFEQSQKAYRIAKLRYKEGEIDLLDTLIIQQQAISAKSNLLSHRRAQLEQRVNLYLSLGGSW